MMRPRFTAPAALALGLTLGALVGCSDNACKTGPSGGGHYALALDGACLEEVSVGVRAGGVWSTSGTDLVWQPAASGGLLVTLSAPAPAEALELAIPSLDADQMLQEGYQSWSFSGTVAIPLDVALDDDGRASMKAARTGDVFDEVRGVSYHAAVFRKGDTGRVVLVASLTADHAVTGIAATRDSGKPARLSIVYGPQRERLPVDPADGRARSEVLYLATADTPELALAQLSAELVTARAAFTPKRPPGGWFSWNQFFAGVDESEIRGELDLAQNHLLPAGMPLVEIDDGWELAWGNWQENAKFPAGLPALASDIRSRGLVAGVWLAPFLVDVTAPAAGSDPSLFVRGADGKPLVYVGLGLSSTYYVLDGTNPAAMAVATDQIRRLAAGGFTFFKLDFLYAGALAGTRTHDVTGVEAMRAGLGLVREAAGPDAVLNLCGAPILPVLGLGDSLRIGADSAYAGLDASFMMVGSATRSLAARSFLWPLVWPDPDQAQLRPPLTMDEARVSAVAAALAGAPYGLGDDLAQLDPTRRALALDPVVVDLAGAATPATPDGIMVDAAGSIAQSPLLENGLVTPPPGTWHATGKSGNAYTITFDWTAPAVTISQ